MTIILTNVSNFSKVMNIINAFLPDERLYGGVDTCNRSLIQITCMRKTRNKIRKALNISFQGVKYEAETIKI